MSDKRGTGDQMAKYPKPGKFAIWCGILEVEKHPVAPGIHPYTVRGRYTTVCAPQAQPVKPGRAEPIDA